MRHIQELLDLSGQVAVVTGGAIAMRNAIDRVVIFTCNSFLSLACSSFWNYPVMDNLQSLDYGGAPTRDLFTGWCSFSLCSNRRSVLLFLSTNILDSEKDRVSRDSRLSLNCRKILFLNEINCGNGFAVMKVVCYFLYINPTSEGGF